MAHPVLGDAAFVEAFGAWPADLRRLHWTSGGADSKPQLPLASSVRAWTRHGMAWVHRRYESPVADLHVRRLLGHEFTASEVLSLDPTEAAARRLRGLERIREDGSALQHRWDETWWPEIETLVSELLAMDPSDAGLPAIAAMWRRADEIGRRLWAIHFEIVMPAHHMLRELDELVRSAFGDDPLLSARSLTAGETSWTTRTADALDRLVEAARDNEAVRRALDALDPVAALQEDPATLTFRAALDKFLAEYGKKLTGSMTDPSWIEDPTPVLAMVGASLGGLRPVDREAIVEQRRAVEDECRDYLAHESAETRDKFWRAVEAGREAARLLENHNFWLDQQIPYGARRLALLTGRRLAERGLIADREDIWYLDVPHLVAMGDGSGLSEVVRSERAEMARAADMTPPAELGAPAPDVPDHPMTHRASPAAPEAAGDGDTVVGQPGSRGVVIGRARVVERLSDAPSLQPGEVLVTVSTSPSWVPWYRLAAAVVTDVGGALAHAAIVAREMGIPAVVGARSATRRLTTGMWIEVDGTHGRVRVLDAGVDAV